MSRPRVLTWTLMLLRASVLAMQLLFVAYFVCVQINAIAYLAGQSHAIISGTSPPVPIDSEAAAVGDIVIGLVFEAAAGLIVAIAAAFALSRFNAGKRRTRKADNES